MKTANTSASANSKNMVFTGFCAAMIFCGIQAFRIPMPAAVGTPFLHFGHIFVLLSLFMIGPIRSTIAGVTGYMIFDLLNGYTHAIPNVLVTTIAKCILIGFLFSMLKRKAKDFRQEYYFSILCAILYGILNIVLDFLWAVIELMIAGSTFPAAFAAELTAIPASVINAVFAVIGIAVLYIPVIKSYRKIV